MGLENEILNLKKNPQRARESAEVEFDAHLRNLNTFIAEEYARQGVPQENVPVITRELFSALRRDEAYRSVARETPNQAGIRRRDFLGFLGLSLGAGIVGAKAGAMITAGMFQERVKNSLRSSKGRMRAIARRGRSERDKSRCS